MDVMGMLNNATLEPKPQFDNEVLEAEQVEILKNYVKKSFGTDVFVSVIERSRPIYVRGMSVNEMERLTREFRATGQGDPEEEFNHLICTRVIVHPTLGIGPGMLNLASAPAGIKVRVIEDFNEMMGYKRTVPPVKL